MSVSAKSGYCTPHLVECCPKDRLQKFSKAFASLDLLGKEAMRGKPPNNPGANLPGRPSCSELHGRRLPPLKAGTQTQAGRLRISSPAPCSRVQSQTAPVARGDPAAARLLGQPGCARAAGRQRASQAPGLRSTLSPGPLAREPPLCFHKTHAASLSTFASCHGASLF